MVTLAIVSQVLLALAGVLLMIVVLLQRGRGGGLAGAFGGLGGQSAFGTKAGDVFTRITIVIAIIWVVLAGGSGFFLRASSEEKGGTFEENVTTEDGAGAVTDDGELDILTADPLDILTADPILRPGTADDPAGTDEPADAGEPAATTDEVGGPDAPADTEAAERTGTDDEAPLDESDGDSDQQSPEGASPAE